jgi:hypothetical protein
MVDRDELREQLVEAFEGAAYPVTAPMDLLPALPEGPETTFESDDFSMTAAELNSAISTEVEFPFRDAESLADAAVRRLDEGGHLDE